MAKQNIKLRILVICILIIGILAISGCKQSGDDVTDLDRATVAVKIMTEGEGVYRFSVEDLQSSGLDLNGKDLRQLRLSMRGIVQPLYIFPEENSTWLEFYARESDSLYTSQNIYILELGNSANEYTEMVGGEFSETSPGETRGVMVYPAINHLEENVLYFPQVVDYDHWFWLSMTGGNSYSISVNLENLAPGLGQIRIGLWGNSDTPEIPDHHLVLQVNGQGILDIAWDGRGEQVYEASIPEGVLREGENNLSVNFPGDTESIVEVNWVNWLEIEYPRYTIAQADILSFPAAGQNYLLQGFTGVVHIYDISDKNNASFISEVNSDGNTFSLFGQADHRYYVVGEHGFQSSILISPISPMPDFQKEYDVGVDYLAIGPEELLISLDELLSYRAEQGLRVLSVPLIAIYDQYNYGFPEPGAIRDFLLDISQSMDTHLSYVLLLGDASYDPRNYLQQPITNILPTFFVQTLYGGQTASDFPFSDLNGDFVPEFSVARLPASTTTEVEAYVHKILNYEHQSSLFDGDINILAIADGQEELFYTEAQTFVDNLGDDIESLIYAPAAGAVGSNGVIAEYIEEGYSIITYFGHGSVMMWGKDQLFTVEEAFNLSNTELPIMINMTCLTGLFTHPLMESITEAFLFNPSGGAAAVLASSSLTLPSDQRILSNSIAEGISAGNHDRIGDLFLSAQRHISGDTVGIRDVLNTFMLFGDPAIVLVGK